MLYPMDSICYWIPDYGGGRVVKLQRHYMEFLVPYDNKVYADLRLQYRWAILFYCIGIGDNL